MSDISPSPVKGGTDQKKQQIMVAVLGVVFLLVLVFMVLKPFSGGDSGAPPAPADAPVESVSPDASAAPTAAAPATPEATTPLPPPARPARSPFDPPR